MGKSKKERKSKKKEEEKGEREREKSRSYINDIISNCVCLLRGLLWSDTAMSFVRPLRLA